MTDGAGRRATFGEFGVAVVDEVLTPRYLEGQLNAALGALLKAPAWMSGFPAELRSARAAGTRLVSDDGQERLFAVTVRAELAAEVGPRALGFGIDTEIEVDLTARVRAFRPAVIGIEIDPVVADDVRITTSARSDWLPRALLDDGGARLGGAAQRSLPLIIAAVNRALTESTRRREVDVLDRIARFQRSGGPDADSEPVRTGTLGTGEELGWPLALAEQEQVRLRLWAGSTGDAPAPGAPSSTGEVRLEVVTVGGAPVAATALPVRRRAPDLDTAPAPLTVTATDPADHRVRLANGTGRPVAYRVAEQRAVLPGARIGFAEFGSVLVERGITREIVGGAVARQLARHEQSMFSAPALVRGTATPRLAAVTDRSSGPDERCFGLLLDIGLDLLVGPGANATALATTLRAELGLRITTTVAPAGLRLEFEPLAPDRLRVVTPPDRVGGRYLPIPRRKLTELLPGQVAEELNRRLRQSNRRIVAAEVVAGPPPGFTEPHILLRSRIGFSGTVAAGRPGRHPIRLAEGQRILVTGRVTVAETGPDGTEPDRDEVELAVCDDHGGVWAADQAPVPADGPVALELWFTAPETGQWRLRISSAAPADLDYRIGVRPVRPDDEPDDRTDGETEDP